MPFVLGLTGGTGSGKSSLRPIFEKYGYVYIDTDKLARKVTDPDLPYLSRIIRVFGKNEVCKGEELDRHALAKKAFSSSVSTAVLNLLTHPAIIEMSLDIIKECGENGKAVIDAPLLFEAGMDKLCNAVLAVIAPTEKRIERIKARDGISEEEAKLRIERQHDDSFFTENCDYVLVNDFDFAALEEKAKQLIESLAMEYGD